MTQWCAILVTSWRTPQIFRGREPSCSVKWSVVHLLGKMEKGLIKSGGHMPKNMFQVGKHGVGRIPGSHGSAKNFRQILARSKRTMRTRVVCTDIFVPFASPKVNSYAIQRKIVKIKQKTTHQLLVIREGQLE